MTRDLVGTTIPVVGRVFRNTKMKSGFSENYDTPSFSFDETYENNERWMPADMSREAELGALRKSGVRLSAESTPLPESFSKAAKYLKQLTRKRVDASRGRVKFKKLTFEQVLMKLHWDTSPGWRWTNLGYKTKGDVIADPKMLAFLRKVYDEEIEIDPVFTGSLKAELRPESRVHDKKTRMFQIAPIEHFILLYKYFGDFLDWFVTQFQDISPLGESPFGGSWDAMIRDLETHPLGYSLDGASFDYWINEQFYALCKDYVGEFVDLSDIVKRMFNNTAFAAYVDSLGNVIATAGTNKSGWLFTLFLNTFVIICSIFALWIEMFGDDPDSMDTFWRHVKFRTVGDDNMFTRSEAVSPFFTGENYIRFMAPFIPFEPAYETALPAHKMSFLSKRTAYDDVYHKYVPTWAFARVYSAALYDKIKKGGCGLFDRCMKLFNLRILSFYDKQAYKQLDAYCAEILYSLEKRFRGTPDYQTIYDLYWSEDEIRSFFCAEKPLRKIRYVVDDFYNSYEAEHLIPEAERNFAQSAFKFEPVVYDTKEIAMQARKFVTEVNPLQASNSHAGEIRPVQLRPSATSRSRHRRHMSKPTKLSKAAAKAVDREVSRVVGKTAKKAAAKLKQQQSGKAPPQGRSGAASSRAPQAGGLSKADVAFVRGHRVEKAVSNVQAKQFAAAQLNPIGSNPVANPLFTSKPSGLCKVHDTDTMNFSSADGEPGNYHLNDTNSMIVLRRDPRRLTLDYKFITEDCVYQALWPGGNGDMDTELNMDLINADDILCPLGAIWVSGDAIHGPYLPPGTTRTGSQSGYTGLLFTKSDANGAAYLKLYGFGPNLVNAKMRHWYHYNGSWNYSDGTFNTDASGNGIISLYAPAMVTHYTWSFDDPAACMVGAATNKVRFQLVNAVASGIRTSVFGQKMAPEFWAQRTNWESCCVNAVAALLSNRTETVSLNGSTYAIQVDGTEDVNNYLPASPTTKLSTLMSNNEYCFDSPAKSGLHAPVIAADVTAFHEVDCCATSGDNAPIPAYDLNDTCEYVIAAFEVDAKTDFGSAQIHRVVCAHLQFKSKSQVFNYVSPRISIPEVETVIELLAASNFQFTENPNHWKAIKGWLKGALGFGGSVASAVAPAFGQYGPAISAAGKIATIGSSFL